VWACGDGHTHTHRRLSPISSPGLCLTRNVIDGYINNTNRPDMLYYSWLKCAMRLSLVHCMGSGISRALTFWSVRQWLELLQLNLLKYQYHHHYQQSESTNLFSQFHLKSFWETPPPGWEPMDQFGQHDTKNVKSSNNSQRQSCWMLFFYQKILFFPALYIVKYIQPPLFAT